MDQAKNQKVIEALLLTTNRKGIQNLLNWMNKNNFYNAPCSSRYHLAEQGGLAQHSLNVFHAALTMTTSLLELEKKTISFELMDSIAICTLLHDLGKAGQFNKPNYIENENPENGAFKGNKDLLYIPHEVRSIAIASQFIELTEEEQFAILYHNGLYGELKSVKGNETKLYMILHFADMWASRVLEKE